ncbi:MAG TPA: nuclear transport factor 2 family protein [Pseudonocardiaceae bacterium]|nr:nuclear transport factor 2 family protein [Pseudonocardiaceae bacterium]
MTDDERQVLDTVHELLATVTRRDADGMARLLVPGGAAVQSRDHVVTCTPLSEFPTLMPGGTADLEERFHEPLVRVDDDIAMVWAHYDFLVDGAVHHWGTNILSLLKENGRWRVSAVADNGRTGPRPADWEKAATVAPASGG